MTATPLRVKDPDEIEDYTFDFYPYLAPAQDSIASVLFVVPAGLTKVEESRTGTNARVRISGGTADAEYVVICRVTCASGRVREQPLRLRIVSAT